MFKESDQVSNLSNGVCDIPGLSELSRPFKPFKPFKLFKRGTRNAEHGTRNVCSEPSILQSFSSL